MKKNAKFLLTVVAALLLVTVTASMTIAYLTSSDTVTNTFTVGNLSITLDETEVSEYGLSTGSAQRVQANTYKLIPGHEYTKDPTVHFAAKSEAAYLFVTVKNDIVAIEASTDTILSDGMSKYKTVAEQITNNGWTALEGVDNTYYQKVNANESDVAVDYKVFSNFAVIASVENDALADYADKTIVVNAYAVQADGFDNAAAAWTATFGATAE